ncbi:MAG TPA: LPS export ABC transporter periplasmic protein LptC [Candidatus Eisenbacteria bacterium]|nr:LPS export ABC transporter periplasmic protein LptC [Candidatus Eisenbacteria bacterium]
MRTHGLNLPLILIFGASLLVGLSLVIRPSKPAPARPDPVTREELVKTSADQQLQKFSLTGFDDKGKTFWNLEGETAKIDPGQTVYLDQNVTLKLKDDTVVRTDRVRWSQDRGSLRTDAVVYVDNPNAKIRGIGAAGRPAENFIQLNRQIEMKLTGGATVTCSGPMKIYYSENKMIFFRKVRVVDQRGVLTSNRMDVFFGKDKKVEKIVLIGNVVIERGTDTTHSQRAIYVPETGSIRLEGNPEITLRKGAESLMTAGGGK